MQRQLGRYRLVRRLGVGAMAVVFLAVDEVLGRKVAVKMIRSRLLHLDGEAIRKRFAREARLAALLCHPNIVLIHDMSLEGRRPYIVMEYVRGCDLKDVLDGDEPLDLGRKLSMALQLARALRHAHRRGVIHRDVKPANIRVLDNWRVKLMDFGIATLSTGDITRLTQRGSLLGTVKYMAPERILGKELTPAADVFSFGILLYELLTGGYPFDGPTVIDILYRIVTGPHLPFEAPVLSNELPDLSADLHALVEGCLAKPLEQRFASIDPVVAELARLRRAVRDEKVLRLARGELDPAPDAADGTRASRRQRSALAGPGGESTQTTHEALAALLQLKVLPAEDADIEALLAPLSEEALGP